MPRRPLDNGSSERRTSSMAISAYPDATTPARTITVPKSAEITRFSITSPPNGSERCDQRSEATRSSVVRHLRYERRRLVCETDYVRGRMMKTDVTVFPGGRFTLTTTNRGEAASRWVAQLQGKKILRPVPNADESERGE